jgi:hypothetical protein
MLEGEMSEAEVHFELVWLAVQESGIRFCGANKALRHALCIPQVYRVSLRAIPKFFIGLAGRYCQPRCHLDNLDHRSGSWEVRA